MSRIYCALVIIGATIGIVHGQNQKVIVERIKIADIDGNNPYFGQWEATVDSSGEKVSFKTPYKSELPANMKVKMEISLDGDDLPEIEMDLCEALDDDSMGKDVIEHGLPEGEYPSECPIQAGDKFEVKDYPMPKDDKIPQGTKDGPFHSKVTIFEEGKDPLVTIDIDGEILHY